jgi:integrase
MSVRKREWGKDGEAWVVDYFDQNRKRRLKTFKRKKDADAYHAKVTVDVAAGVHTSGKTTIAEAGALWLKSCEKDKLERDTLVHYDQHLRLHIVPFIGKVKLAEFGAPAASKFEDDLAEQGRSPAMVKKVFVSLSGILADAMDRGLVAQNVLRNRRRQKKAHVEARHKERLEVGRDIPTPADIRALIPHLGGRGIAPGPRPMLDRERPLILTAIFTGLRASELRGLRWQDVDLAKGELHVRQRADRFATLGPTKSASGRRIVPMLPMVVNALKEWRLAAPRSGDADLVFGVEHGAKQRAIHRMTIIRSHWHPLQIRAGLLAAGSTAKRPLPKYSKLHALRHFYASWCINRRAEGGLELPLKMVSTRLGHASIAITSDIYGHLFPAADHAAEMRAAETAFLTPI